MPFSSSSSTSFPFLCRPACPSSHFFTSSSKLSIPPSSSHFYSASRPSNRLPSLLPLLLPLLLMILLGGFPTLCDAQASTGMVRIVGVLPTPLQPFGAFETPCAVINASTCQAGFPLINAYLRNSAQSYPDQIVMTWIDDNSKFIQFHPSGLSANALAWERMNISGWLFYEVGTLTSATSPGVYGLMRLAKVPPYISNAHLDVDQPLYNLIQRQLIITAGGVKIGLLVLSDYRRLVFPMYDPALILPNILNHLRQFYYVNMTVVMYGRPQDDWPALIGMDIDVLILGPSSNSSVTAPPPIQYLGKTVVIARSSRSRLLTYADLNVTQWLRTGRDFASFSEVNLAAVPNFTTTPINDSKYYQDLSWMQGQIDVANSNDAIIGSCADPVPWGHNTSSTWSPCRSGECPIGNWWTKVIHESVFGSDVAFINGGSMRDGWPAGPERMSQLWASNPFVGNLCIFSIYGVDLYDIFNYSFTRGSRTGYATDSTNNGGFLQIYGARFTYNPSLSNFPSRLLSVEILSSNGSYVPLERAKIYKVGATSFICGGGDGYGFIKVVPGTLKAVVDTEMHAAALQRIAEWGNMSCPAPSEGRMIVSNGTTPYVMAHVYQTDCGPNTIWVPSLLDCKPCPVNYVSFGYGSTQCTYQPPVNNGTTTVQESSSNTTTILIAVLVSVAGALLLIFIAIAMLMNMRRKAQARALLDAAPTGEVTMCFTDIQGSTALWDQFPNEMADALDIHNRVIREEIAKCDGYEVKTIGDSFMIAFRHPIGAIECGINIQRRFLEEDWPETLLEQESCKPQYTTDGALLWRGLRVRMGMQIGEPEAVPDYQTLKVDYFGPMVNQAARVESKAHGGEIVVTKAVVERIEDRAKEREWVIKYLGDYSFKGVSQKLACYSVHAAAHSQRIYPADKPSECEKCAEAMLCPRCDTDVIQSIMSKHHSQRRFRAAAKQAVAGGDDGRRGSNYSVAEAMRIQSFRQGGAPVGGVFPAPLNNSIGANRVRTNSAFRDTSLVVGDP